MPDDITLTIDGAIYDCVKRAAVEPRAWRLPIYDCVLRGEPTLLVMPHQAWPPTKRFIVNVWPSPLLWHCPVGEGDYQPEWWYCATWHDLTGTRNANGYKHTGIDINLDVPPWGDVERSLSLGVYAIADGAVTYSTPNWSGVPMIVIRHEHAGAWLWVRYAHIGPEVPMIGTVVESGQRLGGFADWKTGDHLHFDMALDSFTREWLTPAIRWVDPVPVLKAHLDPVMVDAMLARG